MLLLIIKMNKSRGCAIWGSNIFSGDRPSFVWLYLDFLTFLFFFSFFVCCCLGFFVFLLFDGLFVYGVFCCCFFVVFCIFMGVLCFSLSV